MNTVSIVLIALITAILVTIFEAIAVNGSDNLMVPLSTHFLLGEMINQPFQLVFEGFCMVAVVLGLTGVFFRFLLTEHGPKPRNPLVPTQ